ncbi:thiamine pyrophosphate-dependent enzyme [Actinokineospora sp. NPDC004072]
MNKTDAVREVIAATGDEPVVFTTGYACRIARGIADRPNHFYMTGSMGLASSIGVGIAQATGLATVVVDGDGSVLMNPVGLVVAGALGPLPLVHVVLDDGRYDSTGGQAVPSATDLGALALACGYREVHRLADAAALRSALARGLGARGGPVFLHCVLTDPDLPITARVGAGLGAHAERFSRHLRGLVR